MFLCIWFGFYWVLSCFFDHYIQSSVGSSGSSGSSSSKRVPFIKEGYSERPVYSWKPPSRKGAGANNKALPSGRWQRHTFSPTAPNSVQFSNLDKVGLPGRPE